MSQTQEVIESIQGIATESAKVAIEQYSSWYLTNAIVWMSLGVVLILIGLATILKKWKDWKYDPELKVLTSIAIASGVLFIVLNITNLFHYEAYAIHQLLNDLRGS